MALSDISQEIQDTVVAIFQKYGDQIATEIKNALINNAKVATEKTINSINFRIDSSSKIVELEIVGDEILKYLEKGRSAGKMPPIQEILRWIRVKNIDVHGIISKNVIRKSQSVIRRVNVRNSEKKAAYAIAKNIMKKGIKGTPLMQPVLDDITPKVIEDLQNVLIDKLQFSMDQIINEAGKNLHITYTINT